MGKKLPLTIDYEALERLLQQEINVSMTRGSPVVAAFITLQAAGLVLMNLLQPRITFWMPCLTIILIGFYTVYVSSLCRRNIMTARKAAVFLLPLMMVNFFSFTAFYFLNPSMMWVFVTGPGAYANFIIIIASGFIFNSGFSRLTGIVTGVLYYASFLMMQEKLQTLADPGSMARDILSSPVHYAFNAVIMVFAGFLVGSLSTTARRLLSSIIREEQEKSFISSTFGMIVDPRVKDELMNGKVEFGGEVREVTVLFADIRGFTSFSEKMHPRELLHFMKEYFDLMNGEIGKNEGTIMEYVGDEIMVLFGAPLPQEQHAIKACRAASMMHEALERQRPLWQKEGKPAVKIGVGIHSGPMLVGNIGSSERFKYGALGDNVNLGSRLQALTKTYGVDIIASGDTVETAESRFHTRELDRVTVRGRQEEITIYEIVAPSYKKLSQEKIRLMETYREGHSAYTSGEKAIALRFFLECLEIDPTDGPAKFYLQKLGKEE